MGMFPIGFEWYGTLGKIYPCLVIKLDFILRVTVCDRGGGGSPQSRQSRLGRLLVLRPRLIGRGCAEGLRLRTLVRAAGRREVTRVATAEVAVPAAAMVLLLPTQGPLGRGGR